MKNVLKTTATAAVTALAIGGFSLAAMSPAVATGTASPAPSDTVTEEVGAYVYKKLRPDEEAAWTNSGEQRLLTVVDGTGWAATDWIINDIIRERLPADVCGEGWAIQQDKLEFTGTFTWPKTITYPKQFGDGAVLIGHTHKDLEFYGEVPDCGTSTPPPTTPVSTPSIPDAIPTPDPSSTPTPSTPPGSSTPTPSTPPGSSTPMPSTPPSSSTTPTPTPTLGTDITVVPSGTTTTPPAAASAQLAQTGANAPVMASLAGAGVLAVGLGAAALVRSRRGAASSDA